MAGLDPAIHDWVDARVKPGHDVRNHGCGKSHQKNIASPAMPDAQTVIPATQAAIVRIRSFVMANPHGYRS